MVRCWVQCDVVGVVKVSRRKEEKKKNGGYKYSQHTHMYMYVRTHTHTHTHTHKHTHTSKLLRIVSERKYRGKIDSYLYSHHFERLIPCGQSPSYHVTLHHVTLYYAISCQIMRYHDAIHISETINI